MAKLVEAIHCYGGRIGKDTSTSLSSQKRMSFYSKVTLKANRWGRTNCGTKFFEKNRIFCAVFPSKIFQKHTNRSNLWHDQDFLGHHPCRNRKEFCTITHPFLNPFLSTHTPTSFYRGIIHPSQRNVGLEQNLSACHQSTVSTMKIDNNKLFLIRPFGQNLEPFWRLVVM